MAQLRFEIWEGPESVECSAVSESWDRLRDKHAVRREIFHASTYEEAMAHHHQVNGWEPYRPIPGVTDIPFTEEQRSEQEAYLKMRPTDLSA